MSFLLVQSFVCAQVQNADSSSRNLSLNNLPLNSENSKVKINTSLQKTDKLDLKPLSLSQLIAEFKKVPRSEILEANFKQHKKLKEFNLEIATEGNFQVYQNLKTQKNRLLWIISKPESSKICIDETLIKTTSVNIKDGGVKIQEVKLSELGENASTITILFHLLQWAPETLHKEFSVFKIKEKEYLLKPLEGFQTFFLEARIKMNEKYLIEKVQMLEKSKDENTLEFFDHKSKKISMSKDENHC